MHCHVAAGFPFAYQTASYDSDAFAGVISSVRTSGLFEVHTELAFFTLALREIQKSQTLGLQQETTRQ